MYVGNCTWKHFISSELGELGHMMDHKQEAM